MQEGGMILQAPEILFLLATIAAGAEAVLRKSLIAAGVAFMAAAFLIG